MQTVPTLIQNLCSFDFSYVHEVIVVDDGSNDGSAEFLRAWMEGGHTDRPIVTLIELSRNFGEHNAVAAGLAHACGDLIVTMDDDWQHLPQDIPLMVQALENDPDADVVFGQFTKKRHAVWRNIGSRISDAVLFRLVGKPDGVRVSTFRCMRRDVARATATYTGPFPYLDGQILQHTTRVLGIPVSHQRRASGKSGYSLLRLVTLFFSIATGFSVSPLRLSLWIGGILGAFGLTLSGFAIVEWFVTGAPPGWTSIFATLTLLSSVQLILLGILGEYVGRILLTITHAPQYHIGRISRQGASPS